MEFKYAGITAIIALALYIAWSIKKFGENRIRFNCAMLDFITYIKNQIEFFCTPTEEIIDSYSEGFLFDCGFLGDIEGNDWTRAVEKSKYIDDNSKNIIFGFSKKLGKTTKEEQISNCEYAIAALDKQIDSCRADVIGKYKAYSSLAVICGFMIVILLI